MDDAKLTVTGLDDLRRSLREIDRDLPKELAAGLAEAAEIVAHAAQAKMPQRTGRAAASIKVRKSQTSASLATGGTVAPYEPWLDFGGRVGRHKSAVRPFLRQGRYVYPALRDNSEAVAAKVDAVLERMAGKAGFDTEGTSTDA